MNQPKSPESSSGSRGLVIGIVVGLVLWATIIVWGIVRNQEALDWRKPFVMLAVIGGFLGVWVVLMLTRRRQ